MAQRKKTPRGVSRGNKQVKLLKLANALLDTALISHVNLIMHHGSKFMGYIDFSAGSLDEDKYDALRTIVNRNGGKLIVLSEISTAMNQYNLRAWAGDDE